MFRLPAGLQGTINGTSTVVATLLEIEELSGSSAGVATVTGTLLEVEQLVGSSTGIATVSGQLTIVGDLAGQSDGQASATGQLTTEAGPAVLGVLDPCLFFIIHDNHIPRTDLLADPASDAYPLIDITNHF